MYRITSICQRSLEKFGIFRGVCVHDAGGWGWIYEKRKQTVQETVLFLVYLFLILFILIVFIFDVFFWATGEFAPQAAEREMVTALTARKEALLEKLKEKTDELKKLCLQEAVSTRWV